MQLLHSLKVERKVLMSNGCLTDICRIRPVVVRQRPRGSCSALLEKTLPTTIVLQFTLSTLRPSSAEKDAARRITVEPESAMASEPKRDMVPIESQHQILQPRHGLAPVPFLWESSKLAAGVQQTGCELA